MILNELFDRVAPYEFSTPYSATFMVKDKPYTVEFTDGDDEDDDVWDSTEVFFVMDNSSSYKLIGTGDEFLVFSTVVRIINDYVSREHPPKLHFSASLSEPSRVRLYDRMVKVLAHGRQVSTKIADGKKYYIFTT